MRFNRYTPALLLVIIILLIPIGHSLTFNQETNSITQTIRNIPYYYVDNNLSNVDSSGDKGTHSNFTAQQYGPDSIEDTLTEESIGESKTTLIDACSFEGTFPPSGWTETPSDSCWERRNNQAYDGSYSASFDGLGGGRSGDLATSSMNCSDASAIYVDFWYRDDDLDADEFLLQYYDGSGWITVSDLGSTTQEDQWLHFQEKVTDSQYFHSNFAVRWSAINVANKKEGWIDYVTIKKEVGTSNYELDLEVQWTNVDYTEANEQICIYGGTMSAENIEVEVWNGSAWHNLCTDLSSGWNNITVSSYMTSSTFTIRFKGGTETTDATQDYWNIDVTLLHVWT
ncbi:MAG: hypothetical protein JSW14_05070 [Candidatus Bathyarchaeum sp.]|nr:MAG: hypothetical protein JSW14_05070 [Candidatus Bathyarchaeum sp.]